jgi:hypothetical protein
MPYFRESIFLYKGLCCAKDVVWDPQLLASQVSICHPVNSLISQYLFTSGPPFTLIQYSGGGNGDVSQLMQYSCCFDQGACICCPCSDGGQNLPFRKLTTTLLDINAVSLSKSARCVCPFSGPVASCLNLRSMSNTLCAKISWWFE